MRKRLWSLALSLILILSLAVGGSAEQQTPVSPEDYAGLYVYLGYYMDKQFVVDPELVSWSVTLKGDGTGSLYWGEDNQGPISDWSMTDGWLVIHAGVSEIEGTIVGNIMLLAMENGITIGWAGEGVDYDRLSLVTLEDFLRSRAEAEQAAVEEPCGTYYPLAKLRDGYFVAMPEGMENGRFILNEDGSAQSPVGDAVNEYVWELDGEDITFRDAASGDVQYTGTLAHGILTLNIVYTNPDGNSFTAQDILAKRGADTSAIDTITIEEYNALPREQKNG